MLWVALICVTFSCFSSGIQDVVLSTLLALGTYQLWCPELLILYRSFLPGFLQLQWFLCFLYLIYSRVMLLSVHLFWAFSIFFVFTLRFFSNLFCCMELFCSLPFCLFAQQLLLCKWGLLVLILFWLPSFSLLLFLFDVFSFLHSYFLECYLWFI